MLRHQSITLKKLTKDGYEKVGSDCSDAKLLGFDKYDETIIGHFVQEISNYKVTNKIVFEFKSIRNNKGGQITEVDIKDYIYYSTVLISGTSIHHIYVKITYN